MRKGCANPWQIWNDFNKKKTWSGFTKILKEQIKDFTSSFRDGFVKRLAHLGALTTVLDNYKRKGFFTRQLYDRLNVASENSLQGKLGFPILVLASRIVSTIKLDSQ